MDLSPYNHCRSDQKHCQYGRAINILVLGLTMLLISGFAQAGCPEHPEIKPPLQSSHSLANRQ